MNSSINISNKVLKTLRLKNPKLLLLESCNNLSQLKIIHGYMIRTHIIFDIFAASRLISLCINNPSFGPFSLNYAHNIFSQIETPNLFMYNALIKGFSGENPIKGFEFYVRMLRANIVPDNLSFPFLVRACAQLEGIDMGIQAHGQIVKHGFENDVYVQNSLVYMYSMCGDIKAANEVFSRMLSPNVVSWTSIIAGFNKIGDVEMARELFDKMPERNLVTWSTMINGYAKNNCFEKAVELFQVLKDKGIKANETVMVSVISSYAHLGAIELGEKAHDYVVKNNLSLNVILGTALVDIHGGLVEKGLELFESMKRNYGIEPRLEHYGCVVDLLGRAGKLAEAEKFVLEMPVKPNVPIWGALLGACRIHRNAEIAERVGNILIPLLPEHSGYYVLLSNIYARTNRWENVETMRQMMKEKGVKKPPGYSLIEVDGKVHNFKMGDKLHPEIEMIERKWDEILRKIRLAGYTGNTSDALFDIDEEEKENALHRHSEKLAIAYGVMRTEAPAPIRIVKNLRVCEDCHTATKLISKVFGRELIVRDRNRFHHFREGSCSCMDYW
ncbi:hypothetical protein GOBAR_AA16106 [Gossypium barbadense]|uniref:DYW domain-containing protein n=1 Tax=Gossypium barbadense TaxID=3634 RepID=A0A2P5XMI3_GOSBA|nr:hypothetical protein GOBAR_AA16106 [Gossypium barbadense]